MDNSLYCSLCSVHCTNSGQLQAHLGGKKHKKKTAAVDPNVSTRVTKETLFCKVCNLTTNSQVTMDAHMVGKQHKKNMGPQVFVGGQAQAIQTSDYCRVCDLKVTSSDQLKDHLAGQKHAAKLSENHEEAQPRRSVPAIEWHGARSEPWSGAQQKNIQPNYIQQNYMAVQISVGNQAQAVQASRMLANQDASQSALARHFVPGELLHPGARPEPWTGGQQKNMAGQIGVESQAQAVQNSDYCRVCDLRMTSSDQLQAHLAGQKHAAKISGKPRASELGQVFRSIPASDSPGARPEPWTSGQRAGTKRRAGVVSLYCGVCNINTTSEKTAMLHYDSPKHCKRLKLILSGELPMSTPLGHVSHPCLFCNISLGTLPALESHQQSASHLMRVKTAHEQATRRSTPAPPPAPAPPQLFELPPLPYAPPPPLPYALPPPPPPQ